MFDLLHWITCKHRDVHQLPLPPSLVPTGAGWTELGLQLLRKVRLQFQVDEELRNLSVPTPGHRDASIGSELPSASPVSIQSLPDMLGHMWVCSRCGQAMGMLTTGCSTPPTTPLQPGS